MTYTTSPSRPRATISNLPSTWRILQLREISSLITKGTTPTTYGHAYVKAGVPFLRAEDVKGGEVELSNVSRMIDFKTHELLQRSQLQTGDVLITIAGAIGRSAWIPRGVRDANINQAIAILRLRKEYALPEFISYQIGTGFVQSQFESMQRGVAQKNLNLQQIGDLYVVVPPIETQNTIVSMLRRADRVRELRVRANELTNKIVESLFLKTFGDKEPQITLGDVAIFVSSGSTPLGGENTYLENGITFIREQNVLMNELDLQTVAHLSEEIHHRMRRTWVKNGDVLLNITGASLGRVAVYRGEDDEANVNQHVCIIRLDRKKAIPEYVSSYLSTARAQKQIWTIQAGASRQALNFKQVKSLSLYLPHIEEQEKFVRLVTDIHSLKDRQRYATQEIAELFDSLTRKAFRGEQASAKVTT
jgi:type I restriction enzyme S subunit